MEEELAEVRAAARRQVQEKERAMVRRFERLPVSLPAIARAPQFGGTGFRGLVRYVAAGGMMVEFPVEVVPGSLVRVILQTSDGPLEVEARVVWTSFTDGAIRHGLAFPEPKDPDFAVKLFAQANRGPAADPGSGRGAVGVKNIEPSRGLSSLDVAEGPAKDELSGQDDCSADAPGEETHAVFPPGRAGPACESD